MGFWEDNKVSAPQALSDRRYFFGMLVTSCRQVYSKIIIERQADQDGIWGWIQFKDDFDHDGSAELRIDQLEHDIHVPYTGKNDGGLSQYIDTLQAGLTELEQLEDGESYPEAKKKRLILSNLDRVQGIAHIIQTCKDATNWSFTDTASYLRRNAVILDRGSTKRLMMSTSSLGKEDMMVDEDIPPVMDLQAVADCFAAHAASIGREPAYYCFNTQKFRLNLSVPDLLWKELAPTIRTELMEARKRVRAKARPPNGGSSGYTSPEAATTAT